MNNIEVSIKININPTDMSICTDQSSAKMDDGHFRLVLDKKAALDIDALEDGLLHATYPAMRDALAHYLEEATRKKALAEQEERGAGYEVVRHGCDYRVDGEVGRFEFGLFDVLGPASERVFEGSKLWPSRKGQQWYQTTGFKELALMTGVTQRSYRKTATHFNRSRRQEEGGTALNTLRDGAEAEGTKVIHFLERKSAEVLKSHHFTEDGTPDVECPVLCQIENCKPATLKKKEVASALAPVAQAMRKRGLSEELIDKVNQGVCSCDYEHPKEMVNISMDDVGVKEQKAERSGKVMEVQEDKAVTNEADELTQAGESTSNKRPTVQNTVAQIEHKGQCFTLTGTSVHQVLLFVLAFVLNNSLIGLPLRFFTDGYRSLQNAIIDFFSWHPAVSLVLDWFHLVKKFKEELSLACRGRKLRNQHLSELLRLLWFGLLDEAQYYLLSIPASDLKDIDPIERLINYLERNRKWIPCYALRRQLGLPNSSNPVERANNLVTANRQKRNGMSWSEAGTHALTALSAVVLNGDTRKWVMERVIPLKFPKAA